MVNSSIVSAFVDAVIGKISGLINSHNTSNSAHTSLFDDKQDELVSGSNIKTINNQSLLGSGNISISGGGGGSYINDYYWDTTNKKIVLDYSSSVDPSNIVTNWSDPLSDDKVPSEKLVKETIDNGGGGGGSVDIVTSWEATPSDTKVASEKLTKDTLDTKITKSSTTGLVKNDGSIMTSGTGSGNYSAGNHTHSNYISTSSTTGLIKNDGSIMTSGSGSTNYAAGNHTHSGYVSATKVASWASTPSDNNVPTEKLVKEYIDNQIGTAIQYIQQ